LDAAPADPLPPLFGLPFAVKDNVDVAGRPTTAGCPDYAYLPAESAPLVKRLLAAGAVLVGKTNLDQFATGLTGTRSPFGACASPLDPALISGGSSSGSAVAVSAGLVSFAIGTDTAGSGRVPAALTNVVGLKPSRGLVSTSGIVPACRSLDCPSVLALSVDDALSVLAVIAGFDPADPYSRRLPVPPATPPPVDPSLLRIGVPVPEQLDFAGDAAAARVFAAAVSELVAAGVTLTTVDIAPFLEAGRLLYEGPWIAERYGGLAGFLAAHPNSVHPVTHAVLTAGHAVSGPAVFAGQHRLAALRRRADLALQQPDALVVPTVPTTFSLAEVQADPFGCNDLLGRYTTFANLLDLAALAVPAGLTPDGRPHGVTILAPAGGDATVAGIGTWLQRALDLPLGATPHRLLSAGRPARAHAGRGTSARPRTTTAPRP